MNCRTARTRGPRTAKRFCTFRTATEGSHIFRQDIDSATPGTGCRRTVFGNHPRLNPEGTEIFFTSELSKSESKESDDQPATQTVKADAKNPADPEASHQFRSRMVRMMRVPLAGGTPQVLFEEPGINNFQCARAPPRPVFSVSS